MTKMIVRDMQKFIRQNKAETTDFYYGCLQDNFILACKRGFAFCYERYVNPWSSAHTVFFVPYKDDKDVLHYSNAWDIRRDAAEREVEKNA